MFARVLLLAIAALNLIPVIVAVSPRWSLTLYGFALDTPALDVVMRHSRVILILVMMLYQQLAKNMMVKLIEE